MKLWTIIPWAVAAAIWTWVAITEIRFRRHMRELKRIKSVIDKAVWEAKNGNIEEAMRLLRDFECRMNWLRKEMEA